MARGSALLAVALVAFAAGCGSSSEKATYNLGDVKGAYYRAADSPSVVPVRSHWQNPDFHSHTNYVPLGGIEACPLAQRANGAGGAVHVVQPRAGEPTGLYVVEAVEPSDELTETVTQGALVFGTDTIADQGMDRVAAAIAKCPSTYEVRGGPSPILGTYQVTKRPVEIDGWQGYAQQLAHTYPQDDVYYEDFAHLVLHRANVILYVDVVQKRVIGDRAESSDRAEAVAKTVLKRLG